MKKVLALALSLALIATLAISGTVAYLQDTDEDVNVMTLGNVKIEQHEYERAKNDDGTLKTDTIDDQTSYVLQDFTQDKPLLPIVGDPSKPGNDPEFAGWDNTTVRMSQKESYGGMQVFAGLNAQDKFVTVENTGKSDAYVRTIVAIEAGSTDGSLVGSSYHGTWAKNEIGLVKIDGYQYHVVEYVYKGAEGVRHENGILPADDTTYPNLSQVYLKSEATNEDMEAIDGNGNGTLDILVLSQAVQAQGFADAKSALDTAFGKTAENAAEWFGKMQIPGTPLKIADNDALKAAIEAGETNLSLAAGTYNMPAAAKGKTLTISGTKDSIIKVVPAGQGEAGGQLDYSLDGSTVTFNGVTIETNSQLYAGFARMSGTYNNCVIQNTYNLGTGNSEFNNCTINITNEYLRVGGASKAVFNGCTFNTDGRAILVFQDGTNVAQTVTVKDCTFNATAAANTWNGIHVAAVSIDGSQGGTYVVNLEGTNTVDSDFNGLWQIKAGEANVTVNE